MTTAEQGKGRHVLHVTACIDGGVPRYVAALVEDQLDRGWAVAVAGPGGGDLEVLLAGKDAKLVPWAARRDPSISVLGEIVRLRRIVRELEPDLVHLHSSKAGLAGRLALRSRVPTIFTPHAWSFEAVRGVTRSIARAWEAVAARWSDAIVCVSEAERDRGASEFGAEWRVVSTGVDLAGLTEGSDDDRRAARARLGLRDAPLVVCVGRLCEQKGQDVLLRAWPAVANGVSGAQLALVGDGPDAEKLRALASPGVLFPGARNNVKDWLAAADVVAVPSRWEGMSLVVLEALASGRSIVMSDVDGARETVEGIGAVVPREDPNALAAALVERLVDPEKAAAEGRKGRARAEAFHDFTRAADGIASVYDDVLRARTAPADTREIPASVG